MLTNMTMLLSLFLEIEREKTFRKIKGERKREKQSVRDKEGEIKRVTDKTRAKE